MATVLIAPNKGLSPNRLSCGITAVWHTSKNDLQNIYISNAYEGPGVNPVFHTATHQLWGLDIHG